MKRRNLPYRFKSGVGKKVVKTEEEVQLYVNQTLHKYKTTIQHLETQLEGAASWKLKQKVLEECFSLTQFILKYEPVGLDICNQGEFNSSDEEEGGDWDGDLEGDLEKSFLTKFATWFKKYLHLAKKLAIGEHELNAYEQLITLYLREENFFKAKRYAQGLFQLANRQPNLRRRGIAYKYQGEIYLLENEKLGLGYQDIHQLNQAIEQCTTGYHLIQRSKDWETKDLYEVQLNLGILLTKSFQFELAEKYLFKATKLALNHPDRKVDRTDIRNGYNNLIILYQSWGKGERWVQYLEKDLALAQMDHLDLESNYWDLVHACKQTDDLEKLLYVATNFQKYVQSKPYPTEADSPIEEVEELTRQLHQVSKLEQRYRRIADWVAPAPLQLVAELGTGEAYYGLELYNRVFQLHYQFLQLQLPVGSSPFDLDQWKGRLISNLWQSLVHLNKDGLTEVRVGSLHQLQLSLQALDLELAEQCIGKIDQLRRSYANRCTRLESNLAAPPSSEVSFGSNLDSYSDAKDANLLSSDGDGGTGYRLVIDVPNWMEEIQVPLTVEAKQTTLRQLQTQLVRKLMGKGFILEVDQFLCQGLELGWDTSLASLMELDGFDGNLQVQVQSLQKKRGYLWKDFQQLVQTNGTGTPSQKLARWMGTIDPWAPLPTSWNLTDSFLSAQDLLRLFQTLDVKYYFPQLTQLNLSFTALDDLTLQFLTQHWLGWPLLTNLSASNTLVSKKGVSNWVTYLKSNLDKPKLLLKHLNLSFNKVEWNWNEHGKEKENGNGNQLENVMELIQFLPHLEQLHLNYTFITLQSLKEPLNYKSDQLTQLQIQGAVVLGNQVWQQIGRYFPNLISLDWGYLQVSHLDGNFPWLTTIVLQLTKLKQLSLRQANLANQHLQVEQGLQYRYNLKVLDLSFVSMELHTLNKLKLWLGITCTVLHTLEL